MDRPLTGKKTHAEAVRDLRDPNEFRRFLDSAAEGYNDAQLKQLCQDMFVMAELLLDLYLIKKKG